jgi:predicted PurR-regulated permease PerM
MALALFLALKLHLLMALLAGMLVFELVQILVNLLQLGNLRGYHAKMAAVAVIASVTVALLRLAFFGGLSFLQSGADSLPMLLKEMAAVVESSRSLIPAGLSTYLPADVEELQLRSVNWLRSHANDLQMLGREALRTIAHILIGMIIGAIISLREVVSDKDYPPLAQALVERVGRFGNAFHQVVFAQVRIAALNTFFTWLYLCLALPLLGIKLPLLKTLLAVTFVAGLLPVLGNLISNTAIVLVSMSWSVGLGGASLGYLVVIHKLEYFLNAHIIGSRIRAGAWELLIAMLLMESAFGTRGLIAAPIYYAYLKEELKAKRWI